MRGVAVAAALSSVLAAAAHAAPAPASITLAGTTVVTGSRTAQVAVRLPRAVDFHVQDLDVSSPRGRITAVVLKKVGPWQAPLVAAKHVGFCAQRGCETAFPKFAFEFVHAPGSTNGLSGRLPAGEYRLYLVTDGAPATFTFRFRGLRGSTRITPRTPARATVANVPPAVATPAASPSLFAGGSHRAVPRDGGLNHTSVWKVVPVFGPPSAVGVCEYVGAPPSSAEAPPYQLPCASGRGDIPPYVSGTQPGGQAVTPLGPGRFLTGIHSGWMLGAGTWGLGGYHNTPGPVSEAYVQQLWLDF